MEATAVAASSAAHAHYSVSPFSALPPSVADGIFQRLTRLNLAECSLVCKAWRYLPCAYLHSLTVGEFAAAPPPHLLKHCCHLQEVHVSSSATSNWPAIAAVLQQQQLPSLRRLAIQHSSNTTPEQLQQLQHIMQVQGQQCSLQLALTDKQSLKVLLSLLPLQQLQQLDFNVPYLPEHAADLLAEAAALQAAGSSSQQQQHTQLRTAVQGIAGQSAGVNKCSEEAICSMYGAVAGAPAVEQRFSVGVWVCCWGGCTGIGLSDAVSIQQQLQTVGCSLHGIESINCCSSSDVAALGAALAQLPGLKALGFNCRTTSSSGSGKEESAAAAAAAAVLQASHSSRIQLEKGKDGSVGTDWLQDCNSAALANLVPLSSSLQQLTIHGGFTQHSSGSSQPHSTPGAPPHPAAASAATPVQHPLAALTGLTKLQLLKQWHSKPLPVQPIALLTGLAELALERSALSHPAELACLSSLTQLRLLSLVLTVTALDMLDEEAEQRAAAAAADVAEVNVAQLGQVFNSMYVDEHDIYMAEYEGMLAACRGPPPVRCCCCCNGDAEAASGRQHTSAPPASTAAKATAADVSAANSQPLSAGELQQQICSCPCSAVSNPQLLDWRWLRHLQQLQVAWLQVPHLDLAYLPASLTELDVQQPHDLTPVSITCSSSSSRRASGTHGSSSNSSSDVWLPNLKRLVLPRTLQIIRAAAWKTRCAFSNDSEADNDLQAAGEAHSSNSPAAGDSSEASDASDDSDEDDDDLLQLHYNALLLLELAAGCPELHELQLVQWELPPAAVLAAARQLRYLKLLSLRQPGSKVEEEALLQQLAGVRGGSVRVRLQEQLVLSSYPWSSVMAVH